MRQKIVFFTTGMTAGGAERVIATLANALNERGFEVVIAMIKGEDSAYELASGVKLRSASLTPGLKNLPRAIAFYSRLVKQESPDVVASFSTKSDLIALLSKVLLRTRGRLVVSDRADPNTRDRRLQLASNVLYRWSDALVCQSQSVANYYREKCKPANISVIANPLNQTSFGDANSEARRPTVVSVGRLADQKNHRLAVMSFDKIREVFPELKLKVFGTGPLQSELEQLIKARHLEGIVTLEGVIPDVIRRNANASLFLFTSNYEGYPNALMEAAATGIPTVTTDFSPGTAREIIEDGVNGYIVARGDQEAVVQAAIKALSGQLDPEAVAAASQRVRERHQTERILEAWMSVFRSPTCDGSRTLEE